MESSFLWQIYWIKLHTNCCEALRQHKLWLRRFEDYQVEHQSLMSILTIFAGYVFIWGICAVQLHKYLQVTKI